VIILPKTVSKRLDLSFCIFARRGEKYSCYSYFIIGGNLKVNDKVDATTSRIWICSAGAFAVLSGLGLFLGFTNHYTLWLHLACACIFYGTILYRRSNKDKSNSLRNDIHQSFILLIMQICFFAIIINGFIFIFSEISTSSVLQLFANISIYICVFSLNSFAKAHKEIKNRNLPPLYCIPSKWVMPLLMIIAVLIALLNLHLIYLDIQLSQPNNKTFLWLISYWIAILVTPLILNVQNTLEKSLLNVK